MLSPKVSASTNGTMKVLTLRGEFIGGGETDDLRDALSREAEAGTKNLLIDLAGVSYLNSTALGVLIAAHTSFAKREARIGLCNVSKNIQNIFVITKLALVFNIYGSVDEGVHAMQREA